MTSGQIQEVNQRRIESLLEANKVLFDKIDGVLPENKEIRDRLFGISGQRGKYPQCFITVDDSIQFVGLWEDIEVKFYDYSFRQKFQDHFIASR